MALSDVSLTASLGWTLTKSNTGFSSTKQGPDSKSFSLAGIDTATFDQLYVASFTLAAAAATQTIDLTSVTNLVDESVTFTKALSLLVLPVGSECTVQPGASNPLQWFFGGTTQSVVIPAGGLLAFSYAASGAGATVDGTRKTLKLTNSGATSLTVSVVVIGSTV